MDLSDQIVFRVVSTPRKEPRMVPKLGGPQRQVWTFWRPKTEFPPPGTKHRFAQTKSDPLSPTVRVASSVISQPQFRSTHTGRKQSILYRLQITIKRSKSMIVRVWLNSSRNKSHMQWFSSTSSSTCPFLRKLAAPDLNPQLCRILHTVEHCSCHIWQ